MAPKLLGEGDELSDFEARTLGGGVVTYRHDAWQRKMVAAVRFREPESAPARAYRARLGDRERELTAHDTLLLVVGPHDRGADAFPAPGLVIADRWGGVRFVAHPADDEGLPAVGEVIDWLRFVQVECPECQGESR